MTPRSTISERPDLGDAQRADRFSTDLALVDYAIELIGIYGKAAGIPLEGDTGILDAANIHNVLGGASRTKTPTPDYPYLSVQDAEDIRIGYNSVTDDGKIVYKGAKPAQPDH